MLTSCLRVLKLTKSQMTATAVTTKATNAIPEAMKEPTQLVNRHSRKAMKHSPAPTGCRTMTLVSALEVVSVVLEKSSLSTLWMY